ncbi:hypothetical protein Hanom_Chr17g01526701 [Helianthus anomalus]
MISFRSFYNYWSNSMIQFKLFSLNFFNTSETRSQSFPTCMLSTNICRNFRGHFGKTNVRIVPIIIIVQMWTKTTIICVRQLNKSKT